MVDGNKLTKLNDIDSFLRHVAGKKRFSIFRSAEKQP